MTEQELRRFSHSLIDTYLECPKKAMYRYVDRIPSPKTAALVRGSACDLGWNEYLLRKMDGLAMPLEDLLFRVEEEFRAEVANAGGKDEVEWNGSTAGDTLDSALEIAALWHDRIGPLIEPTGVQLEYHQTLPSGRDFIGFVDYEGTLNGRPGMTCDNKTGGRALAQSEADKTLQPYAYAWLKGEPIDFAFTRVIDTGKTQKTEIVTTTRSEGDIAWYGELVEAVEAGWEASVFPTNPKSFLCSQKWCPYFERCQPHRFVSASRGPVATENTEGDA